MLKDALLLLLDMLVQPFVAILLLRFHLQWMGISMRNPLGDFIMTLTNFIVLPTRRHVPTIKKLDSATLLLAWLAECIYLLLFGIVTGLIDAISITALLPLAIVKLCKISIYLLMAALVIQAVLSWVSPHSPLAPVLEGITHRFLHPLRQRIHPMGNIDLTPFILIIACQLAILPMIELEKWITGIRFLM